MTGSATCDARAGAWWIVWWAITELQVGELLTPEVVVPPRPRQHRHPHVGEEVPEAALAPPRLVAGPDERGAEVRARAAGRLGHAHQRQVPRVDTRQVGVLRVVHRDRPVPGGVELERPAAVPDRRQSVPMSPGAIPATAGCPPIAAASDVKP